MGAYTTAEHGNPAEMGEPNSSGHARIGMASAVAQDGQAAGRDGRKGRAGRAHHTWEGISWRSCTDFSDCFMFMS